MQEDLARFGLDGEDLAYRFLLHESDLRRFSAGAPIHEDDLPTLEFSAPLALYEASSASDNERALLSHRRIERPDVAGLDPVALSGARGHIRAALAHWGSGRFEAAEAELARVGDPYSHPPETRGELVRLLFVLGRFDEAATAALPSANGAPLPAVARYSKAAEAMRPPSSRDAMNRLVTGRGLQGISLGLGDVLMQFCSERSDPDFCLLALEQYEVAARREPGLVLAWNRIGATLYQMGRLDEAAGVLRHAVDLHPNFRNSHFNLGLVEQGRGNLGEARRCFEAALRIDPSWQPARSRLEALGPG
jgi:tetratricopeptide (TPR) repeat protein